MAYKNDRSNQEKATDRIYQNKAWAKLVKIGINKGEGKGSQGWWLRTCRSFIGFQSCSTKMTMSAPVRFNPSPPTSVVNNSMSIEGSLLNLRIKKSLSNRKVVKRRVYYPKKALKAGNRYQSAHSGCITETWQWFVRRQAICSIAV